MNEPDWTRAEDYEYTKKFKGDPTSWAWEFLRRNPDYRADFAALKSGEFKEKGYSPPKLPNETEHQWQFRCIQNEIDPNILSPERNLARKWGMRYFMCDPTQTVIELKSGERAVEFDTDVKPVLLEKWDDVERLPTFEEEGGVVLVDRNRLLISFDLTGPLEPQIKSLKMWFGERKTSDVSAKKPQAQTFVNCLRVLDAMSALGDKFENHLVRDVLFKDHNGDLDVKIHNLIATAKENNRAGYRAIAKRRTPLNII